MNITALITQPNHDLTTYYISAWAEKVVQLAKKKDLNIISLKGKRANKTVFTSITQKKSPQLIFLNGHGNSDLVAGQNNEVLVKEGENEIILKGRITYALSCQSAKRLGKAAIKGGASAYIGYQEDFIFYYDREKTTKPLNDTVIKLFLEPSNTMVISLIKGHSSGEAWRNSQRDFKKKITNLVLSQDKVAINTYLPGLIWDMKNQVCLGNNQAVLKNLI